MKIDAVILTTKSLVACLWQGLDALGALLIPRIDAGVMLVGMSASTAHDTDSDGKNREAILRAYVKPQKAMSAAVPAQTARCNPESSDAFVTQVFALLTSPHHRM